MRTAHFLVGRCNPDSANGVEKTVYYLSRTQAVLGNTVALFALTAKPPLPIPGVTVRTSAPNRLPFILPKQLLTELIEWQPDVVHLHSVYCLPNACMAHRLRRQSIPYVVTPHGALAADAISRRWYIKAPYGFLVERPNLNRAAFVHAVADAEYIKSYGVIAPIVTAANALDMTVIPSRRNSELLASRYPQVRGRRVFLFLGRLDAFHKGLDLLLNGFFLAQIQDAVLVLVGPDCQGGQKGLEALACKLGIASRVIFAGPAYGKEKFDVLASADVFVHTSRWEAGLPFAVLEAAALGKPVLLSSPADPGGMLALCGAAVGVDPHACSIAEGIRHCAAMSTEALLGMGSRARQLVRAEFRWGKTATTILEAYGTHAA